MNSNIRNNKNYSIECARFIASCGIVWFHIGASGAKFAYGGLPIFMIFSIAFIVKKDSSIKSQLHKSFQRLIFPWIFWSLIYAILKIIEAFITGSSINAKFHYWMFLTGASIHLWYLPFAFMANMAVFFFVKHFNLKLNIIKTYIWAIIGGSLFLLISGFFNEINYIIPLAQWLFIIPAIPIGLFFSLVSHNSLYKLILKDGLWIIILCYITAIILNWEGLYTPYLVAICVCSLVWLYKLKSSNFILYLGKISYGIYLVHGLFVPFWLRAGVQPKSYLLLLFTIISSIIFVILLNKTKLKEFV